MPVKRKFFKKKKTEEISEKEKAAIKKLEQGTIEFKKTLRTSKKKKEDIKKRPYFPSISRSIPETLTIPGKKTSYSWLEWALVVVLVILGVAWNIWVGIALYRNILRWSSVLVAREKLYEEMTLWENITQKYPSYRDAYVEGAIFAYRLGDKNKEQYFLDNLQVLDPNFPITKSLEQLVNLQNQLRY